MWSHAADRMSGRWAGGLFGLLFGLFGIAPAALGQAQGSGQWISEVTTQDGDSIVEPGETATVSLWMDMDPSVGEELPDGTTVYGFGTGTIDVLGGLNAEKGEILGWVANDFLDDLGDDGTTDGTSIFGVELGQLLLDPFDFSDPIFLMSFEWTPTEFTSFDVFYDLEVETFLGPGITIWKDDGTFEPWPVDRHSVIFSVVPSPGAGAAFLIVASLLVKARRTRDDVESNHSDLGGGHRRSRHRAG